MRNPRRRFLIYDHEPRLSAGSKVKNQLFQSDFSPYTPKTEALTFPDAPLILSVF